MIRDVMFDLLRLDSGLQALGIESDGANVHQSESVDMLPLKPALVLRYGGSAPGVGYGQVRASAWTGAGIQPLSIWVHDVPGDYYTVDRVLDRLRTVLSGVTDVPSLAYPGCVLGQCDWRGNSTDLRDDGYGTITKFSDWNLSVGWR